MAKKEAPQKLTPEHFRNGAKIDYVLLKQSFFGSEHNDVRPFLAEIRGKIGGNLNDNTKWRWEEKSQRKQKAADEANKAVQQQLIEKYKPKTEDLMQMKASIINICKVYMNNALEMKTKTVNWKKVQYAVLKTNMNDLEKAYKMIKIELWEPTNISSFDPDSWLWHFTVWFGDGVWKSQFIWVTKNK